jgi:hypothetical protein
VNKSLQDFPPHVNIYAPYRNYYSSNIN